MRNLFIFIICIAALFFVNLNCTAKDAKKIPEINEYEMPQDLISKVNNYSNQIVILNLQQKVLEENIKNIQTLMASDLKIWMVSVDIPIEDLDKYRIEGSKILK